MEKRGPRLLLRETHCSTGGGKGDLKLSLKLPKLVLLLLAVH